MHKNNVILDLDGTCANLDHRLPFIKNTPKDWEAFHQACVNDTPIPATRTVANLLSRAGYIVHILSGRNDTVLQETIQWLDTHGFQYDTLTMRAADDRRDDVEVKKEMIAKLGLTPHNTLLVMDDRQRVVDMWRELGFTCHQVNAWKE